MSVRRPRPTGRPVVTGTGRGATPGAGDVPVVERATWTPARLATVAVLGLVAGFAGTVSHRLGGTLAWGVLLSVLILVGCSLVVRAAAGRVSTVVFAVCVVVAVLALAYAGPGGDVLVANDAPSSAWLVLSVVASMAGLIAPARWFSDEPV